MFSKIVNFILRILGTIAVFILDLLFFQENISAEEAYKELSGDEVPEEISDLQGGRLFFVVSDTYFFKFRGDQKEVLEIIADMPCQKSSLRCAETCSESRYYEDKIEENFDFYEEQMCDNDYWNPDEIENKEYYECLTFPYNNMIIFDGDSDVVYYIAEGIRE